MDKNILSDLFTPAVIQRFIFGGIGIGIFIISYIVLTKILKKFAYPKMKPNSSYLVTKLIKYAFYVIIIFLILGLFNIKLTALLEPLELPESPSVLQPKPHSVILSADFFYSQNTHLPLETISQSEQKLVPSTLSICFLSAFTPQTINTSESQTKPSSTPT